MSQPTKYKETKALSQSSLKSLDWNPKKFYEDEYLWLQGITQTRPEHPISDSMKIGELVDIHYTRPEDLDSEYVIIPEAPTGQMLIFVDEFFRIESGASNGYTVPLSEVDIASIANTAYSTAGFKRDTLEKVLERFKTEGAMYYTALRKSIGKTVASPEIRRTADYIIKSFDQDLFIGPIMRLKETPMLKIYNQMEIYFTWQGVALKALLDKVVVDHEAKTIQPYDIKTASDAFPSSFMNWRYDLQGAFYTLAIEEWAFFNGCEVYKILPFKFIVGYSTGQRPEIWEMTQGDLTAGEEGGINRFGRQVKGYKQLIEQYKWHVENNKWDYSQEVYESNGVRLLNCYKDE